MAKSTIQMLLELQQACCHIHVCGKPFPVVMHPLSEKPFFNDQPELPLALLHSISSCPTTGHQREETSPSASTALLEENVGFDMGASQPSLLQTQQSKQPQLLLWPSKAWSPSSGHTLIVWCPSYSEVSKTPHNTGGEAAVVQCRVEQSLPSTCWHSMPHTSQGIACWPFWLPGNTVNAC